MAKRSRKSRGAPPAPAAAAWPAASVEMRSVTSLIPYAKNARTHPKSQIDKLAAAIVEWGWTTPILVSETGEVISGHGRLLAAKKLGIGEVPVMVARGWSDAQRKAYVLADNQIALDAGWDKELLSSELVEIKALDFDLALTGFDAVDLDALMRAPPTEGELDDAVPPSETPTTRAGDVWILGDNRVLCGDATKKTDWALLCPKGTDQAALVHTDPPYGVSYQSEARGNVVGDDLRDDGLSKMLAASFKLAGTHARANAAWYVWHASVARPDFEWALRAAGVVVAQEIVWIKPSLNLGWADYHWQHEPCLYGARAGERPPFYGERTETTVWRMATATGQGVATVVDGGVLLLDGSGAGLLLQPATDVPRRVRRIRIEPGSSIEISGTNSEGSPSTVWAVAREKAAIHPTQKPVALVRKAILNSTQRGELVLDPYAGSGSTLIAATQLERRAALMELDAGIVDSIVTRWQNHSGQHATLEQDGSTFTDVGHKRLGKKKRRTEKAK